MGQNLTIQKLTYQGKSRVQTLKNLNLFREAAFLRDATLYNKDIIGTVWSIRTTIPILAIYLFLVLPGKNIFFHTNPWLLKYTDTMYFFIIISLAVIKLNNEVLGLSTKHLKGNLTVGFLSGGILISALILLDFSIDLTSLADQELFSNTKNISYPPLTNHSLDYVVAVLVIPIIEQVFFTGIIFQSFFKKYNPIFSIYALGIIYSLAGLKLSLGAFGLGIITCLLFIYTKTIYASIIFHSSCVMGEILIKHMYPRLKTLLGFFF